MILRPVVNIVVFITVLALPIACVASGSPPADPVSLCVAVASDVASDVSERACALMKLVSGSQWGARYGVLNPVDPETSKPEFKAIKNAETALREELAARIRLDSTVDMAFLAYGDFVLFVERRSESEDERQDLFQEFGGDMYEGPFARFAFGQPCDFDSREDVPHVVREATGVLIGVPICRDRRYVCALYLRMAPAPRM